MVGATHNITSCSVKDNTCSNLYFHSKPCIRGHRASKCQHQNRILVEVRKPGRPLNGCPHPTGACNCDKGLPKYTLVNCRPIRSMYE